MLIRGAAVFINRIMLSGQSKMYRLARTLVIWHMEQFIVQYLLVKPQLHIKEHAFVAPFYEGRFDVV